MQGGGGVEKILIFPIYTICSKSNARIRRIRNDAIVPSHINKNFTLYKKQSIFDTCEVTST